MKYFSRATEELFFLEAEEERLAGLRRGVEGEEEERRQ